MNSSMGTPVPISDSSARMAWTSAWVYSSSRRSCRGGAGARRTRRTTAAPTGHAGAARQLVQVELLVVAVGGGLDGGLQARAGLVEGLGDRAHRPALRLEVADAAEPVEVAPVVPGDAALVVGRGQQPRDW